MFVVVADMMAGVGPFAVPIAKRSSTAFVHANGKDDYNISLLVHLLSNQLNKFILDLNPHSYHYLLQNSRQNHCESRLRSYNLDGRDFILLLAQRQVVIHEAIMNLPQNASDFLDVFIGYAHRYSTYPSIE